MSVSRLALFLETRNFELPLAEDIAVFGSDAKSDLSMFPKGRLKVICHRKPDFDLLQAAGFEVVTELPDQAALAVVFLPRAKREARAMVAEALTLAGVAIIDGQKTDGIDSLYREMGKRANCSTAFSKAHGKTFTVVADGGEFSDWAESGTPSRNADGFVTAPGVFSSDGVDPASALLAQVLPPRLKGRVADFGAGWGCLSTEILKRDEVETLDLVEADQVALTCARANVTDARARFHWADATCWQPDAPLDVIVMNPPFHEGRKGVPALGQDFIRNAARCLAPHGRLFMVSNRHLPYEAVLRENFREVDEIGGDTRFKLFAAARPSRRGR